MQQEEGGASGRYLKGRKKWVQASSGNEGKKESTGQVLMPV